MKEKIEKWDDGKAEMNEIFQFQKEKKIDKKKK